MSHLFRLLRLPEIIGNRRKNIPPLFPVSRSGWYAGIKAGRYPEPVKIGRISAWREEDIRNLLGEYGGTENGQ